MANRTGNYSAFYVSEPFDQNNLGANGKRDFVSYNLMKAWKASDSSFPFIDSHNKNYNVRDDSDWERTLKPRLHDRLSKSKNIILYLSSVTVNSKALREEIDYGINTKGLPVIVVYPDFSEKSDIINCQSETFRQQIENLWDKLPIFRDSMDEVPTIHVPNKKALIKSSLEDSRFRVQTKGDAIKYFFKC